MTRGYESPVNRKPTGQKTRRHTSAESGPHSGSTQSQGPRNNFHVLPVANQVPQPREQPVPRHSGTLKDRHKTLNLARTNDDESRPTTNTRKPCRDGSLGRCLGSNAYTGSLWCWLRHRGSTQEVGDVGFWMFIDFAGRAHQAKTVTGAPDLPSMFVHYV